MRAISGLKARLLWPLLSALLLLGACASQPANPPATPWTAEQVRMVAPTGKLRVALYPGTPTSVIEDPKRGERKGVGHDLGKALAQRIGVPFEAVIFPRNAEVLAAIKSGNADVAFTNASPARARDMDFSQPYLDIELGYLAAPGGRIASMAEIDRPGVRVAVTEGSSSDGVLTQALKNARVVRAKTVGIGVQMLGDGRADVYATNKSTLFEMADELPGARVLDGNWGAEKHAIAIPRGREGALPALRRFVDEAGASGVVKAAIQRAGLRGAVEPGR